MINHFDDLRQNLVAGVIKFLEDLLADIMVPESNLDMDLGLGGFGLRIIKPQNEGSLVLVDTSVWIDHLHQSDPELVALLRETLVVTHPAVLGELACSSIPNRQEFLTLWLTLPRVANVSFAEAMALLENRKLWGRGLVGLTSSFLLPLSFPEVCSGPETGFCCTRPATF